MITIKNLHVGYNGDSVLSNLNFSLKEGKVTALVGPNGAGKSTLLQSLIGILSPISGDITVDVNSFREIGFSAQSQVIDWYTNVRDNVSQGPLLSGQNLAQVKANTKKSLKLLNILDLADKPVDHLSGGQQQRVQIAREIARTPSIYILDEPTTGLDVESAENLLSFLKNKALEGAIVLISSHDLTLVEKYADQLLLIDEGNQKYFGDMDKFLHSADLSNNIIVKANSLEVLQQIKKTIENNFKEKITIENNSIVLKGKVKLADLIKIISSFLNDISSIGTSAPTLRDIYLSAKIGVSEKGKLNNESTKI